jgi:hypothetical protein
VNILDEVFIKWMFFAWAIERLVEVSISIIPWLDKKKLGGVCVPLVLAFVYGLLFSYGSGYDLFSDLGFEFEWMFISPFITALLLVGGSSLIHDLVGFVKNKKNGGVING